MVAASSCSPLLHGRTEEARLASLLAQLPCDDSVEWNKVSNILPAALGRPNEAITLADVVARGIPVHILSSKDGILVHDRQCKALIERAKMTSENAHTLTAWTIEQARPLVESICVELS